MASKMCTIHDAPANELRIVLIGKTGSGKSKTGNSILSEPKAFGYGCDGTSVTQECLLRSATKCQRKIDVVDTPGIFDTSKTNEETQKEVSRSIGMTTPGPHAIILCVKMTRFTDEDTKVLKHYVRYFGEELYKYALIIFTCLDQWEEDREEQGAVVLTMDEYVKNLKPELQDFVKKIDNRYLFFNNRLKESKQEEQFNKLMKLVDHILAKNNSSCYTDEMYKKVEHILQKEIAETGISRDEAKRSLGFFENLWVTLRYLFKR